MHRHSEKTAFIWSIAELLRGDYKQSEYGRVILPLTVLRRLDQILAPTRAAVRDVWIRSRHEPDDLRERRLLGAAGHGFYNTSERALVGLLDDPSRLAANLTEHIDGFSANMRDIIEHFRFAPQIERLDRANLLFLVIQKFTEIDLHPERVSNLEMGYIFEELIRKFSEQSNETAGEHFTPREVIRLMVNLLFVEDDDALREPGVVRTMLDPACGTGGMLSVAEEYLRERNPDARLQVFGQELNGESYAICKSDMFIKGQDAENIKYGNSLSDDGLSDIGADYLISNPPFGVDWTKAADAIRNERATRGYAGRFGPGLPRKNDGSLLFLLHMLAKMKDPADGGSRLAVVFNGSPLFTGAAGSGESEIRRYLLENDLLEAIISLPDQLFYNTGINTYVWLLSNRKSPARRGSVQLVNGVEYYRKMRRSLGNKRKELAPEHIAELVRLYAEYRAGPEVKILANEDFGYYRVTVERPLRVNVCAGPERMDRLLASKRWTRMATSKKTDRAGAGAEIAAGRARQAEVLAALTALGPDRVYRSRVKFVHDLRASAARLGVRKLSISLVTTVLAALCERDESAEICRDRLGRPEPDPDLRDYEHVPLARDIGDYMAEEVLPHAPDAWVDESKTRVGYDIPLTRLFYKYVPPRPLEVIESEIRTLEGEIADMLGALFG